MEKIARGKASALLKEAAHTLRSQEEDLVELREKVAFYERKERVEKIASSMRAKGVSDEQPSQLVDRLMKAAEAGKLDSIEEAVDMVGPDMGAKLASIGNGQGANSEHKLVGFLVGESVG